MAPVPRSTRDTHANSRHDLNHVDCYQQYDKTTHDGAWYSPGSHPTTDLSCMACLSTSHTTKDTITTAATSTTITNCSLCPISHPGNAVVSVDQFLFII